MEQREKIINYTRRLVAQRGIAGLSMRDLAHSAHLSQSVLYYYFADKDELLKTMFDETNTLLGKKRSHLLPTNTTKAMLSQRVEFQLDHMEEVVAVLKYYLYYRRIFPKGKSGFLPDKTYLHIEEVLNRGEKTGELSLYDIKKEARVITHAINGFLLEYYPYIPKGAEKKELIKTISEFLWKAIAKGGDYS